MKPMSIRRPLLDETIRSAWWRFVRLWRPMAGWTLLVFVLFGGILGPLLSAALRYAVFRDDRIIVGNEDLLMWLLTPEGLFYGIVGGGLAAMGSVLRYAGLFRILTTDLRRRPVSVRRTLFQLLPDVPALFRLCMAAVVASTLLLIPLVLGFGAVYLVWLADHDINYYLFVQPPEWYSALAAAGIWGVAWAAAVTYLLLRSLPALPAYLDGHRPLRVALHRAWKRTRGDAARVLWLLLCCVAAWLVIRALAHATYLFAATMIIERLIDNVSSLTPVLLATGAWAAGAIAMDALLSFLGFSVLATVLTKFYYEDTDLHATAPAVSLGLRLAPRRALRFVGRWLHPRRSLPLLAALVLLSGGLSSWLLLEAPGEVEFTITAHRAGAHLATENTLAALEESVQAGADYAEIDVQTTRDTVVVVTHDEDLMRLANDRRRIAQTDYADLSDVVLGTDTDVLPEERRLATLDDFLERAAGRIGLMIELKYYGPDPMLVEKVVERVRERQMEDEVVIISLDLSAVRRAQRLAPDIPTGYIATVSIGDLTRLPVDHLAVSRPMVTDRLLSAAQTRDMATHVWTLNDATAMLDMIERGIDGIITDNPVLTARLRRDVGNLSVPERLLLSLRRALPDPDDE